MSRENIKYNIWLPFTGDYEKQECDIKLKNGMVKRHVYPNAGMFAECCGTHRHDYDGKDVAFVMYRKYYQDSLCVGNCAEFNTPKLDRDELANYNF